MMMMGWDCCWTWNECHALRCVWFMEMFLVNCLRDLAGYGTCCKISSFSSLRCLLSLSLSLSLSLPQVYSGYIAPCFKTKRSIARSQMPMFRCCLLYCNCQEPPHYPAFSNASSHQRLRRQRPLSLFMPSSHLKPRRQHRCLSSYQHRIRDHSLPFLYTPVSRSSVPVGWLCSSQYAMWSCRRSLASVMSRRASHISVSHA
jgi:hypothetical protein